MIVYFAWSIIIPIYILCFQKNETNVRTKYAQNPSSMQQSEYLSVFFVCRKPLDDDTDEPDTAAHCCGFDNGNLENHTALSMDDNHL